MDKPIITMMQEIAEELRGTCGTLDAALEERGFELDSLPPEMLRELDEAVMLCETCGWWCDSHELNDDNNCNECGESE
jgi:hypothetical protein